MAKKVDLVRAKLDSVGDLGFTVWHLISSMISFVQADAAAEVSVVGSSSF